MTNPIWHKTADAVPPSGVVVMTKCDDEHGLRNEQKLVRQGSLWWLEDRSLYVYYTPTHRREVAL